LAVTDPFNTQDNQTCTDTYDDLARVSGNNCGSTWAQTFSFDAFGNVSKSGSISWQPTYNSPANNNPYLTGWNGASYDADGSLLNDTFNTYTWDAYGNLASANAATITYDALFSGPT
jgi:YD repeat-containing protein